MQKKIIFCVLLACSALSVFSQSDALPFLRKQANAMQLIVNGEPFIILGGELGNSTASSLSDMEWVCPKLQKMGLNTMLVPAYWELLEPEEGKFDFTLIDGAIHLARKYDLKIVFLWFGSWKNSMSCYAPQWVKENYKKYTRVRTQSGRMLEIMSAFDPNNLDADKRAFKQLMSHIAETDKDRQTVIMVQVENEIGMLESAREYGDKANEKFSSNVPKQLIDYLVKNKKALRPRLLEKWEKNGYKTQGNWTEVFGTGLDTDEIFMAWYYGIYVQEITQAGKEAYPVPMYLNAALNSRGRLAGQYPSAGPLAHLLDVWRAAAPAIDFLAPDIYDPGFADWCRQYHVAGNPLFIPEIRLQEEDAVRALYALGEHDAIGFSPFSIEDVKNPATYPLAQSYRILHQLMPLLKEKQGKVLTNGILIEPDNKERIIERNGYTFTFRHTYTLPWEHAADTIFPEAGAMLIQLSENEYIIAGSGIVATFGNTLKNKTITGISYIDEVEFDNGKMKTLRRLNGDQDHQGRHLRIPFGQWSIQYVRLYNYE